MSSRYDFETVVNSYMTTRGFSRSLNVEDLKQKEYGFGWESITPASNFLFAGKWTGRFSLIFKGEIPFDFELFLDNVDYYLKDISLALSYDNVNELTLTTDFEEL